MKLIKVRKRLLHLAAGAWVTVLAPADPHSDEILKDMPDDAEFDAELKTKRKRGELNRYWAGIGFLVANYSGPDGAASVTIGVSTVDPSVIWPTSRHYHDMLMDATGHVFKLWRQDGTYRNVPDSIALDNMDDDEFAPYFETARAVTFRLFGFDPWDEWKQAKDDKRNTAPAQENDWRRNYRPGDDDGN